MRLAGELAGENGTVPTDASDFVAFDLLGLPEGVAAGASLDDVQAFIPDQLISATTKPTQAQVETFLTLTSGKVTSRIGELATYPDDVQAGIRAAITTLAPMGAAALAWNAAHPDVAGRGASTYGDWLWAEFLKGIDELLETLNKPTTDTGGAGGTSPADRPSGVFPDPAFYRDQAF